MSSFHSELTSWSEACTDAQLINRVLHRQDNRPVSIEDPVIRRVSAAIENFIKDNQWRIEKNDLLALEKLQIHVHLFEGRLRLRQNQGPTSLEKTLAAAIKLTQKPLKQQDPLKFLGPNIPSLIHEYCTLEDNINLCAVRKDPSDYKNLSNSSETALQEDIDSFVINMHSQYKSDPDISQDLIKLFFQHASDKKRSQFFNSIKSFCLEEVKLKVSSNQAALSATSSFISHIISAIASLPNLQTLNLSNFNVISDEDIQIIAKSPHMAGLQTLILSYCNKLTDKAAEAIACSDFIRLQNLHIIGCQEITDNGIKAIAKSPHMKGLQTLRLSKSKVGDQGVKAIAESPFMEGLHSLILRKCSNLTNGGIKAIAKSPYKAGLRTLILSRCTKLNDKGIKAITKSHYMEGLRTLILSRCNNLSNYGVKAIASSPYMTGLETLKLSFCNLLTDEAAKAIAGSHYIHLKSLDFSGCLITDEGVEAIALAPNMAYLQTLKLNWCGQVTDGGIKAVIKSPYLKKLLKSELINNQLTRETTDLVKAMLEKNRQSMAVVS